MDKIIGISELRTSIASVISEVSDEGTRYIITQHSRAKAVLLSPDELEALEVEYRQKFGEELTAYERFFGKK
jgi:prevent-host-death family protein